MIYLANANTDAGAIFKSSDGTYQDQYYNPNSAVSTQILDYSASNSLLDQTWENTNSTSASDLYNVDSQVQQADLTYDTPDAIFGTTTALADDYYKALLDMTSAAGGGSQLQYYDNTGSGLPNGTTMQYLDYSSTGAEQNTTSDFTTGTSSTTDFNPQAGVNSVTGTFSGINDGGNLESLTFTDMNYGLTFDDRFTYGGTGGTTQEDIYQHVYNSAGSLTGYAEFNAVTDKLVQSFQGNYGYAGSAFSYSYNYGFGYGSAGLAPNGGTDISKIGAHGRLSHGFMGIAHGDPSIRGRHRPAGGEGGALSPDQVIANARHSTGTSGQAALDNKVATLSTSSTSLDQMVQAMASVPAQPLETSAMDLAHHFGTHDTLLAVASA